MGSLSRLSQSSSSSSSRDYLIYAPFCTRSYNDGISTFIDCYNPSNNTWRRVTAIPGLGDNFVLREFAMVSICDYIYIIGGRRCQKLIKQETDIVEELNPMVMSTVHRYNVTRDHWETCAPMITPRFNFACAVSSDNKIYVAGGQSTLGRPKGISLAEVYDTALGEWKPLPPMSMTRYKSVGVMWHGKMHVVGGFVDCGENFGPFVMTRSSAEVYDPERNIWNFKPTMWELDIPPNQIVAINGKLFSSGDYFKPWKSHIETYDEQENLWSVVRGSHFDGLVTTSTPEVSPRMDRVYLTMAPIGNELFFLAGYKMSGDVSQLRSEVHVFDTAINGHGWESHEPIQEESEKRLCGHCCVIKQGF